MNHHRRKIFLITVSAVLSLAAAGNPQSRQTTGDRYREAYLALQQAIRLSYENRKEEALERYEEARGKLGDLIRISPDTNRETIEARIAKCDEAIERLKQEISAAAAPVEQQKTDTVDAKPFTPPEPEIAGIRMEAAEPGTVVEDLREELKAAGVELKKTRQERASIEAELKKARADLNTMQGEIQNLNTSLGMAITDIEKEREMKANIEQEAMNAQQASEEILKSQLAQAIADRDRIKEEAMEAYQVSEEMMRDLMLKQQQEHLGALEKEREKILSEKEAKAQPIDNLQGEIEAYRKQVETARKELNESLKIIASSQQTHKKLLDANREIEKRITDLSSSVSKTETEAELTELRRIASAEEERLKKTDITRGPSLPKEAPPAKTQVLVGAISEKNDEYGKVFIDFVQKITEGEELVVIRNNETIAKLKVSKIFPSIQGGIANVIPKEDAFELRKKDKVFAISSE